MAKDATLIITEKPAAAAKIAAALSGSTDEKVTNSDKVSYYEFYDGSRRYIVGCAVGHLFGIQQIAKRGPFPNFDVEWKAAYNKKGGAFTEKYLKVLKKLAKEADEFIVATDFDVEGEVIGWNVVRFICGQKDAKRMKFSLLTKEALEKSFGNLLPTLNWGAAIAGETRHYIDWFYGINLSRGLMKALSSTGTFRILSIGRVQGPALKIVADREKEIRDFKSEPFWNVFLQVKDSKGQKVEVKHPKDIFKEGELLKFRHLKGKKGVATTTISDDEVKAPTPFDLTTLQTEAYKNCGFTPMQTLKAAQSLYLAGAISYPRTSSQKYDVSIGYDKILKKLKKYTVAVKYAVNKMPTEGVKVDPAHPAIYPTGDVKKVPERDKKIYDLIVKRFVACFCDSALVENKNVKVVVNGLNFGAKGAQIKDKGWMNVYPHSTKESKVPTVKGDVDVLEIRTEEKETKPPRRYSAASLVKELEKRGLGTKCLTGDSKILINNKPIFLKDVFNSGKNYSKEEGMELKNIKHRVISLGKNKNVVAIETKLISKRSLAEDEKIIEVKTDSSVMKLTEDHLVYIYRNNKIMQVPAKDICVGEKLIGLTKKYYEGDILINKNIFNGKYKIQNNEIKHKFASRTHKGILMSKFPVRWSTSLAWMLGYYYGDGSYDGQKYNGSHSVSFSTTEKKALTLLKEASKNIFGNSCYAYNLGSKYKVNLNSVMSYVLIKTFPELDGKKPMDIPKEFIGDFLRGFFDADGNVHLRPKGRVKIQNVECNSFDTPRVKMTLCKKILIEWIMELLKKLDIETKINKGVASCNGKKFDCWTILISGRDKIEKFAYLVGFDSYKEEILYNGLRCDSQKYKILKNSALISLSLYGKDCRIEELLEKTGLSRYNVVMALRRMFKLKIITKKRYTNRNNWEYSLSEKSNEYLTHCMKLVYNKISEDIYEVPVRGLSVVNYRGHVYDISVGKDSPNFITDGHILVHNSTRAAIVETLYSRGYAREKSIEVTELGMRMVETLGKYAPIILDEELTRAMTGELEKLESVFGVRGVGVSELDKLKKGEKKILDEAKVAVTKIAEGMTKNMAEMGKSLADANAIVWEQEKEANTMDTCRVCGKGKLRIMYGKRYSRYFVSCDAYPDCKTIYSLPPRGMMKPARLHQGGGKRDEGGGKRDEGGGKRDEGGGKRDEGGGKNGELEMCGECGFPLVVSFQKGKAPWRFCFNPDCVTNEELKKKREEFKAKLASGEVEVVDGKVVEKFSISRGGGRKGEVGEDAAPVVALGGKGGKGKVMKKK